MNRLSKTIHNYSLRKKRVRSTVSGTENRPRLTVHISNRHITAQVIDDTKHTTIVYASTAGSKEAKGNLTEKAVLIGSEIAKKAIAKKIKKVVFDRGGLLYHGRIKALADSARKEGLEF